MLKRIYLACISILLAVLIINASAPECRAEGSGDIYGDIDEYLRSCAEKAHIPALCVTIVDQNDVLFSKSYGECLGCDTPFFVGSVSKSFTALCIMQLRERGLVDLDAAVSKYLPNVACGDKITVRQLLNHTSGLGTYQTTESIAIMGKQGVHNYANVNYTLLGMIIEAVSDKPYSDYITENIFAPLKLSHTSATLEGSIQNGVIGGHTDYFGFNIGREHKYPTSQSDWITVPAGYISSSANDLGRYLQMYLSGGDGIISDESIDMMFYGDTAFVDGDIPYWYGYGWNTIREPLPSPVLRHSGLVETGTACIFIMPESGKAMAITANFNDYFVANGMLDSLGWGVMLMLLGESPNEISESDYVLPHIAIDLIMLLVLAAAAASLCMLPKYGRRMRRGRAKAVLPLVFDIMLAVFILLIAPIFFGTPLWVVRGFVPDVFITVTASSALLCISAIIKFALLLKGRKCASTEKNGLLS